MENSSSILGTSWMLLELQEYSEISNRLYLLWRNNSMDADR